MNRGRIFAGLAAGCLLLAAVYAAVLSGRDTPPEEDLPAITPRQAEEDGIYIKVGFYGSLTGEASVLGQMGQLGCRLAVDQINNSGGINGKKIRFVEYDDQTNPETAAAVVRKLITEDRVDAIIGSHTSGNILNTVALTEAAETLQIGLGTSFLWTDRGYDYLFRAGGNSGVYDRALLDAVREQDHRRIAVYYSSSDYARAGAERMMDYVRQDPDMELVWSRGYDWSETDFSADLTNMAASNPDAVILYASSENAGVQLHQLRQHAGYAGLVYAPEAFAASATRQQAGQSLTDLVYACTATVPASPARAVSETERDFLERFIKMYGTMPAAETAYRGYDAMMLLAEVFRTAESMESADLRQAMLNITDFEGVIGVYDFSDGTGDGLEGCRVIEVRDPDHMSARDYPFTEEE